ncbi:MAG: FAD-dependent monooxygenase [Aquimonas sp.]|nr:FAD-dependent monooxygenase [Aquimonas sp.]
MKPLHIAIAGYGTAGQAASLLLARDGHRVEVFERVATPGPVGAGFLLQPTGMGVLLELGLLDAALQLGAPVRRLFGDLPGGRRIMDMRYAELQPQLFGLGMQRTALFELLHAARTSATQLHFAANVETVDAEQGRLRTADGREHGPFDLVLAADGSGSRLREALGPQRLNRPYPWGALWCLLPVRDWPHVDELRQRYRGAQRMIGLLPVGGRVTDASPRLSFFWSLPTSDFERWRARGMPAWREELNALWPQACGVFEQLPEDPAGLARATYRDAVPKRWHHGRLCAVGDAAHAMSPQLGQGVNMALLDALALSDALRAEPNVQTALRRYAAERRRHVGIYQLWSRWLTPLFQSHHIALARLRDLLFLPLSRLPLSRGQSLSVLSGTQQGLFGRRPLDPRLLQRLTKPLR